MNDLYEALLFYEDLSPGQREEVRKRLEDHADAAEAFAQWRAIEQRVAEELRNDLPDRHLLVLFALEDQGDRTLLSTQEQMALDEARGDIERALKHHPSIETVISDIQDARADFDDVWEQGWDADMQQPAASTDASVDGPLDTDPRIDLDVSPSQLNERRDRQPRPSAQAQSRTWRRVAATAVAVAAAVMVIFLWPREAERTVVEVAQGDIQVVDLADGTSVRLVGNSRLSFAESSQGTFDRQVTLDYGRALFDVERKVRPQPFIVQTPTARSTVLGTRFGVETEPERTDVTLATGSLKVQRADASDEGVMLEPGQASSVRRDKAPTAPKEVDVTKTLEWTGLYLFSQTPVDRIAERLSEQHDVEITIAPSLQGEPVTGTFERTAPPKQILEVVATTLGAVVRGDADSGFQLVPVQ
jgi:ferric-dicitrate binding protein FerR (iron transport regulator)